MEGLGILKTFKSHEDDQKKTAGKYDTQMNSVIIKTPRHKHITLDTIDSYVAHAYDTAYNADPSNPTSQRSRRTSCYYSCALIEI